MIVSLAKLVTSLRLGRQRYSHYARSGRFLLLVSVGLALLLGLRVPLAARTATGVVTNLNDSGAGSLRQAIANAAPWDHGQQCLEGWRDFQQPGRQTPGHQQHFFDQIIQKVVEQLRKGGNKM